MVRAIVLAVILTLGAYTAACGTFKSEHPAPSWDNDGDKDGVLDLKDDCKGKAEDYDGFKDQDGCPDDDNDGDKVADADDQCPNVKGEPPHGCPGIKVAQEMAKLTAADWDKDGDGVLKGRDKCEEQAEDRDGWADDDGCPETDADNDGVPDELDQCKDQREDRKPPNPRDGCRIKDADGDGIADSRDRCPRQRGPAPTGCPPDADKDGIPDSRDRCKYVAEDKDGYKDHDGCPDKDNDSDGIPDDKDKCPNKAENYNAHRDEDGCPD